MRTRAMDREAGTGRPGPVYPPPQPPGLSPVLERNIRTLQERRRRQEREASPQARIADAITRFTGSMRFVYLHLAFFGFWIVANLGWIPAVPGWDPSFVVLAMIASNLTIDANPSRQSILAALASLEAKALENGQAIGIVSALPISVAAIAEWSRELETKGIMLVPASALMK